MKLKERLNESLYAHKRVPDSIVIDLTPSHECPESPEGYHPGPNLLHTTRQLMLPMSAAMKVVLGIGAIGILAIGGHKTLDTFQSGDLNLTLNYAFGTAEGAGLLLGSILAIHFLQKIFLKPTYNPRDLVPTGNNTNLRIIK